MFDLLKKKIKGFVEALTGKEEQKPVEKLPEEKPVQQPEPVEETLEQVEERTAEQAERVEETQAAQKLEEKPVVEKIAETKEPVREDERFKPKIGLISRVKSFFSNEVEISESDVQDLLLDLEIDLLESDVSLDTSKLLVEDLRKRLVGKRVDKKTVASAVREEVKNVLLNAISVKEIDLLQSIKNKNSAGGPFVILFVGPNGMGKTTSIAKLAFFLKQKGFSTVLAAGDTFRAASIEQLEEHAVKLGLKIVKHKYGADPTAVAFDAVAHARANKINVVLVDTAGRQETSFNLVKEMEKIARVINPDLKVFVGEAVAGHALVEQVKQFNKAIQLNGLVLTKMDADAKGGSALSVVHETGLPIMFVGLGQHYEDLVEFDAQWFAENVLN